MENNTERIDRIERSLEALVETAAGMFAETDRRLARVAELQTQHAEAQAQHQSRINDVEDAVLDTEAEHRRLLTAQVVTADNLAKASGKLVEIEAKLDGLIGVVDDFIRRQPKQ